MTLIQTIRKKIRNIRFLRKFVAFVLVPSGYFDEKILKMEVADNFKKRIDIVTSCPDNKKILCVKNAGEVKNGKQTMHNGLKIYLGSYYGPEVAQMLNKNNGIHEPQEEYIFQEVLKEIPKNGLMIEMGAFWSFYSLWFNSKIEGARNYMIEPEAFNLMCGKRNFKLNKKNGDFTQAYLGRESKPEALIPTICIDDFVKAKKIEHIDILHSDIQGFEHDMLLGAEKTFKQNKIRYAFISTHNNAVHHECHTFLEERNFIILADIDLNETFSEDGLIVARNPIYEGVQQSDLKISKF